MELPKKIKDRINGNNYLHKGEIRVWNGKRLLCEHNRRCEQCKDCHGSGICSHNKIRTQCKDCQGSSICSHNRQRSSCKDCQGNSICSHNRQRSRCKDCQGNSICSHNKIRTQCKDCQGSSICSHTRRRTQCKDCQGSSICSHNRLHEQCKDCGTGLCIKENCKTFVKCGKLFEKKIHCMRHRESNEYKKNNPKCLADNCKNKALYVKPNSSDKNYPTICEIHADENDINIVEKPCKNCGLSFLLNSQTALCEYCTSSPKIKSQKEQILKDIFDNNNFTYKIHDNIPEESCFKYRPDFYFDQGTHIILF